MVYLNKNLAVSCFIFIFSFVFVNAKESVTDDEPNENQIIFQETLEYIQDHTLPPLGLSIHDGTNPVYISDPVSINSTTTIVISKSSFQAAQDLAEAGYRPMILDMANKSSPGGSVLKGSKAQEETLCRQSNLYIGLKEAGAMGYYHIPDLGGILVSGVTFFRSEGYEFLEKPFQVDVFASAAYDCNKDHKPVEDENLMGYDRPESDIDYEIGTKVKIRASLRAARSNGNDAVVLSAFGCGAFQNDPKIMSQWYKEVINETEFHPLFKYIIFAIIPAGSQNFTIFQDCFSEKGVSSEFGL